MYEKENPEAIGIPILQYKYTFVPLVILSGGIKTLNSPELLALINPYV
jgi:hypothetical protein